MRIPIQGLNSRYWNRLLLNIYWVLLCIYIACQWLIYLDFGIGNPEFPTQSYFLYYTGVPNAVMFAGLVVLEFLHRKKAQWSEPAIVAGGHVFAMVIVYFINTELSVAPMIMVFPLLISMLYLRRRYLLYSIVVCLLYIVYLFTFTPRGAYVSLMSLIIIGGTLFGVALTGYGIIRRSMELATSLQKSLKSEQELLIQNTLMDRMTKIDPLTELYNHKTFHEYLDKLIQHQGEDSFYLHLAVLDIDNFKKVNDTYGHAVGDQALRQVASQIKSHIGSDDFPARYGGEEFAVILTSATQQEALQVMEGIRESIAGTEISEMGGKCVTVSIGLHSCVDGEGKETVFSQADEALYTAKKTGKNRTVIQ